MKRSKKTGRCDQTMGDFVLLGAQGDKRCRENRAGQPTELSSNLDYVFSFVGASRSRIYTTRQVPKIDKKEEKG